jgi:hypothetical protein
MAAPTLTDATKYTEIRTWIARNEWGPVPEGIVNPVFLRLMDVLNEENNVLLLPSPIYIVGNIHGQLDDLLWLFEQAGALKPVRDEIGKAVRPQEFDSKKRFIFLGGYVDYGFHSLNTFLYLACLKLEFPQSIYLLRGGHETRSLTKQYGLYDEVVLNYGHAGLWLTITDCFDLLPVAALIDQDILCAGWTLPEHPDAREDLPPRQAARDPARRAAHGSRLF